MGFLSLATKRTCTDWKEKPAQQWSPLLLMGCVSNTLAIPQTLALQSSKDLEVDIIYPTPHTNLSPERRPWPHSGWQQSHDSNAVTSPSLPSPLQCRNQGLCGHFSQAGPQGTQLSRSCHWAAAISPPLPKQLCEHPSLPCFGGSKTEAEANIPHPSPFPP